MNQGQSSATPIATEPFIAAHIVASNTATTDSDTDVDRFVATNVEKKSVLQRRNFLRGGATATAMTLTSLLGARGAVAQAEQPELTQPTPAMRSQRKQTVTAAGGTTPAVPPLSVIALNRMAFGPRPGDLDAFNALGNTPEAALQAYVEQQLNPACINDSLCDAIVAGYAFQTLGKSRTSRCNY